MNVVIRLFRYFYFYLLWWRLDIRRCSWGRWRGRRAVVQKFWWIL